MKPELIRPTVIHPVLNNLEFSELAALDSCSVANAIESFGVHLRNEGFTGGSLTCRFPQMPPMLGYAVTIQVRSSTPPMKGRTYFENTLWWDALLTVPAPRIVIIEDMDKHPGTGALVGDLHARILKSLGCAGVVTNGAVRDLPRVEALAFQMYSGSLSVSHSYSHIVNVGEPAQIGNLQIATGDLVHGDCHGIIQVPAEIAAKIPGLVRTQNAQDAEIASYCEAPGFSIEGLRSRLKH